MRWIQKPPEACPIPGDGWSVRFAWWWTPVRTFSDGRTEWAMLESYWRRFKVTDAAGSCQETWHVEHAPFWCDVSATTRPCWWHCLPSETQDTWWKSPDHIDQPGW